MPFRGETPLEDVVVYIQKSTVSPSLPDGLPIEIDPNGLSMALKTTTSPIAFRLKGVPLRTTLGKMLAQIELTYFVRDGVLTVTHRDLYPALEDFAPEFEQACFVRIGHCCWTILIGAAGRPLGRPAGHPARRGWENGV